jgi:hypothetical protein
MASSLSDPVDELLSLYGEAAPPDADQLEAVVPAGVLGGSAAAVAASLGLAVDTDARSRARALAVSEVVATEHTYVAGLDTLRAVFYDPLRLLPPFLLLSRPTRNDVERSMHRVLSPDELHAVFANVESILEFHRHLLRRLEARQTGWNSTSKAGRPRPLPRTCAAPERSAHHGRRRAQIGDIFLEEAAGLSTYVPYLVNYKNALTTLATCQRTNADLRLFLDKAHTNPALRGLNIIGLLILPVQRIPRYACALHVHRPPDVN